MRHDGRDACQDAAGTVQRWQDAANEQDIERLLAVSDENIAISGPRGQGYGKGHQLLVDWLSRAGLTMETKRTFARGGSVVAQQHGIWRSPATGEVTGEADFATRFVVAHGKITDLTRYDGEGDLNLALEEAGLTHEDEA